MKKGVNRKGGVMVREELRVSMGDEWEVEGYRKGEREKRKYVKGKTR